MTDSVSMRTDHCGTLRASDIGREVAVCGWVARRREHGEHLAFIDLRDHTGLVQCVVDGAADLRSEYVVRITGTVRQRPDGTTNDNMPTGEIEIGDCRVEILNVSEPPPFQLNDRVEVDEMVRLAHRYVDLRTERMQRNLRIRAKVNASLRRAMDDQGFVEIETPMLIASTPEGARDFVVPSRLSPGSFYALPQSPQLFKQLCMVGGIDRYYQIARCLRDEDLRADRQFEFMQLDAEASFVSQEEVLAFISVAVSAAVEEATGQKMGDVPRMTWQEAQERFGSDKPDIRFGMELIELTPNFAATEFNAFKADCVKGIVVDGGAEFTRSKLDELTDKAKRWGAKGLVWMRVKDGGELDSPVAKFLSADELAGLVATSGAKTGDLLLLVESLDDAGNPVPAHHPFTMPHAEDVALLDTGNPQDLLKVRSQAYDLVLNGWELGSGSVRIHRGDIQSRMFELLGIGVAEQQSKFGFLLDAFRFGAPPHAGFAFGIDRLVALLAGEENIREVIAFPKTQSGTDPLTHAPTPIDSAQLDELGLRLLPTKKND